MSDALEQARHLVAYADKRGGQKVGYLTPHGGCVDIARALIETQKQLNEAVALLQSSIEWCEVCDGTGLVESPCVDSVDFVGDSDNPCPACREPIVNFLDSIKTKGISTDDE